MRSPTIRGTCVLLRPSASPRRDAAAGRRVIMAKLPGYRDESVSIVVAPVVIRSRAFKTIAAVGVIIDF
ncbi:MAG: hypothetical protein WKG01_36670 [Kofleriaceae bacterium]